jgi:transcriptional regulator with XRE-family HTH domain
MVYPALISILQMRFIIYYNANENRSRRNQEYDPFFKTDNTTMEDDGHGAGAFWRRFKNLSGKDLPIVLKTNIKQSTISTWRRRKDYPRADEAVKIAEALGTSVEFLVTGKDKDIAPCSPAALELALIAERLDEEGQRIALTLMRGLETQHPLEVSRSTMEA